MESKAVFVAVARVTVEEDMVEGDMVFNTSTDAAGDIARVEVDGLVSDNLSATGEITGFLVSILDSEAKSSTDDRGKTLCTEGDVVKLEASEIVILGLVLVISHPEFALDSNSSWEEIDGKGRGFDSSGLATANVDARGVVPLRDDALLSLIADFTASIEGVMASPKLFRVSMAVTLPEGIFSVGNKTLLTVDLDPDVETVLNHGPVVVMGGTEALDATVKSGERLEARLSSLNAESTADEMIDATSVAVMVDRPPDLGVHNEGACETTDGFEITGKTGFSFPNTDTIFSK